MRRSAGSDYEYLTTEYENWLPLLDNRVIVYEFPVEKVNAPPVLVQLQAVEIKSWGCPNAVGTIVVCPLHADFAYWLEFTFFT